MREVKIEIEVLEMLHKNLLVIKESIIRVIKIKNIDGILNDDLKTIMLIYKNLIQATGEMLKRRKKEVNNLSVGEKMATYMSVKFNLNKESEIKDIAGMVIQDIKLSSVEIQRIIDEYTKISKTIVNLSNRIFLTNEKCVKILEKYTN
jgi:hypothetical protein